MSIETASILSGATVSATGGTAQSVQSMSESVGTHEAFIFPSGSDQIQERELLSFNVKQPKANAQSPNGYTQGRRKVLLKIPRFDVDGVLVTYDTLSIELATDVKTTDTEVGDMIARGSQLLFDSDFSEFWKHLSTK
jgi:hypothetical protein